MELSEIWIGIIIPIIIGPIFIYLKTVRDEISTRKYKADHEKYLYEKEYLKDILETFYWPIYINLLYIDQYSYSLPIKNRFKYESISDQSIDSYNSSNDDTLSLKNDTLSLNKTHAQSQPQVINSSDHPHSLPTNYGLNSTPIMIESDTSSETFEISVNYVQNSTDINNSKNTKIHTKNIILDKNTLELFEMNLNKKYDDVINIIENNIAKLGVHEELYKEIIIFIKYAKIRAIINEGSPSQKFNIEYFGVKNNIHRFIQKLKEKMDTHNTRFIYLVENPI